MKKIIVLLAVLAIGLVGTGSAGAATYWFTSGEIDSMYEVTSGTLTSGPDAAGNWTATITAECCDGWGDLQVGRDATIEGPGSAYYSGSWADLSAYDSYSMVFTNTSDTDWFNVNLYTNTGWTDIGESDSYYQNSWTWFAPGTSATLTVDLSSAVLLNHVSSIGFNIGTNVCDGDYCGEYLTGKAFVPEPISSTLFLVGAATLGFRRFRKKIKE